MFYQYSNGKYLHVVNHAFTTSHPIPHCLPSLAAMTSPNPFDIFAIQNTIALYCLALDTKDFARLHHVFTPDVETIYPFGGKREGVQSVADAIQKR